MSQVSIEVEPIKNNKEVPSRTYGRILLILAIATLMVTLGLTTLLPRNDKRENAHQPNLEELVTADISKTRSKSARSLLSDAVIPFENDAPANPLLLKVRLLVVSAYSRCTYFRDTANQIDESLLDADTQRLVSYVNYIFSNTNWVFGGFEIELVRIENFCNDASAWTQGTKESVLYAFNDWITAHPNNSEWDIAMLTGRGLNGGLAYLGTACGSAGQASAITFGGDDREFIHELAHVFGLPHVTAPHDFMNAGYTFTRQSIGFMNNIWHNTVGGAFPCLPQRPAPTPAPTTLPSGVTLVGGYELTGYNMNNASQPICPSYLRAGTIQLKYLGFPMDSTCTGKKGLYVTELTHSFCQFELCRRVTWSGNSYGDFLAPSSENTCDTSVFFYPGVRADWNGTNTCAAVSGNDNCLFQLCGGKKYFPSGVGECPSNSEKRFDAYLTMREVECNAIGGVFRDFLETESVLPLYGECQLDFCELTGGTLAPTARPTKSPSLPPTATTAVSTTTPSPTISQTPTPIGGYEITAYDSSNNPLCPPQLRVAEFVDYECHGQSLSLVNSRACKLMMCRRKAEATPSGYLLMPQATTLCPFVNVFRPTRILMDQATCAAKNVATSWIDGVCYFTTCSFVEVARYFPNAVGQCDVKEFSGQMMMSASSCATMGGVFAEQDVGSWMRTNGFGLCMLDFCST